MKIDVWNLYVAIIAALVLTCACRGLFTMALSIAVGFACGFALRRVFDGPPRD